MGNCNNTHNAITPFEIWVPTLISIPYGVPIILEVNAACIQHIGCTYSIIYSLKESYVIPVSWYPSCSLCFKPYSGTNTAEIILQNV